MSETRRVRRSEEELTEETAPEPVRPIVGRLELPTRNRRRLPLARRAADASAALSPGQLWDESVINEDDRVPVPDVTQYPWRSICALRITSRSGKQYVGTGWLATPRLVVTAGHCVYLHDDGGWAKEVTLIPAMSPRAATPFGQFTSRRLRTVNEWISGKLSGSDFGGILLDEPLGHRLGYFSVGALGDEQLKSSWANISGYPTDRGSAREQYYHARLLTSVEPNRLYYDIDTFGGQSGSPIWFSASDGRRICVGVHTSGGSRENAGTRLNSNALANIRDWADDGSRSDEARVAAD